ncbi:hypothetical protein QAD02_002160 [Eretmocerus hayati]|uniref:Uncharacterized protein n=1 Tax=Eretmocerus hayati TaxID=131215 RepID=A0ACC2NJV6_9HYME|nr:hypothetical protein QAD02_002160 [Eretmocerus hayati]
MLVEFANRRNKDGSKQRSAAYQCFIFDKEDFDEVESLVKNERLVLIIWPRDLVLSEEKRSKPELLTAMFTEEIVQLLATGNDADGDSDVDYHPVGKQPCKSKKRCEGLSNSKPVEAFEMLDGAIITAAKNMVFDSEEESEMSREQLSSNVKDTVGSEGEASASGSTLGVRVAGNEGAGVTGEKATSMEQQMIDGSDPEDPIVQVPEMLRLYHTGKPRRRVMLRIESIPSNFPWDKDAECVTNTLVDCYEEVVMDREYGINNAQQSTGWTTNSDNPMASNEVRWINADSMTNCEEHVANENLCDNVRDAAPIIIDSDPNEELVNKNDPVLFDCHEEVISGQSSTDGEEGNTQMSNNEYAKGSISPSSGPTAYKCSNGRYREGEQFRDAPHLVLHFTGLESYEKFELVLLSLGPGAYHLKYVRKNIREISVPNQFFLVLWKLRRNECDLTLATHFGIDRRAVGNIFIPWILFMSQHWSLIDIWPNRDLVDFFLPESFKNNYPALRVIIDGTEFEIQKPSNPRDQQSTFSVYKHRNTYKAVLGCTGAGLISYCSPAYGGSTTDRQIVERSELMTKCDPGDLVMADRGFDVQDYFAPFNVTCMIPTFVKKGRLPHKKVMRDRRLASHRIHIERVIGLIKTFTILASKFNCGYVPIASEILKVCVMLCNFKDNIMEPKKKETCSNPRI